MPTRTYTNSDLTFVEYWLGGSLEFGQDVNYPPTGSGFELTFVSSGASPLGRTFPIYSIDFDAFPSIPASATITKVEFNLSINGSMIMSQPDPVIGAFQITAAYGDLTLDLFGFQDNFGPSPLTANTPIEYEDTTELTKSQLQSTYGQILLGLVINGSFVTSGSLVTSNFSLTVTYDLENYSWYIKPTVQVINGRPTRIIESVEDILAVPDDEDPPDGYEFYGTGEDYPDGPISVWWEDPEEYVFYIFSPISPGSGWLELPSEPTCIGCITLTLGEIEILLADASGIYTLTPGKTNDSLYVRESFSIFVDTVEVKIPNPTIKTGFAP